MITLSFSHSHEDYVPFLTMDRPNFCTLCYGLSKKWIQTRRRQEKKTKTNLFRIKFNEESPHLWEKTKELLKYNRKRHTQYAIRNTSLEILSRDFTKATSRGQDHLAE